jgi:hypothetical protein
LLRHLKPDFKTIADFRRDNRDAFRQCSASSYTSRVGPAHCAAGEGNAAGQLLDSPLLSPLRRLLVALVCPAPRGQTHVLAIPLCVGGTRR